MPSLPVPDLFQHTTEEAWETLNQWLETTDDFAQLPTLLASLSGSSRTRPLLLAIGGLSGAGKSALARNLAPRLGAVIVRADAVRKHMLGIPLDAKAPPEAYAPEVSQEVYRLLAERCQEITAQSVVAIADATFRRPEERVRIEQVAKEHEVPFFGLWCYVSEAVALARLRARSADVSDAGSEEYTRQQEQDIGLLVWQRLNTDAPLPLLVEQTLAAMVTPSHPETDIIE